MMISALRNPNNDLPRDVQSSSLLKLLERARQNKAKDSRDCVFALLGLCNAEERRLNEADYGMNHFEVFRRSVLSHLDIHKNLEFLGACTWLSSLSQGTDPKKTPGELRRPAFPSWVPNWASVHSVRQLVSIGQDTDQYAGLFNSARNMSMPSITVAVPGNPARLNVSVIQIDRVVDIFPFYSSEADETERGNQLLNGTSDIYRRIFDYWFDRPAIPDPYDSPLVKVNSFVRTLTLGGKWGTGLHDFEDLKVMFQSYFQGSSWLPDLARMGFSTLNPANDGDTRISCQELKYFLPVNTSKGYMALTRFGCWKDDLICVVAGCSTPVLLRGPIGRSKEYIVRGEVFIDGFMSGEAVEAMRRGHCRQEVWVLV